ncbi:MAG TPA: hypothetical protein VH170_08950 [Chthoniobacterales bacterium]|nr:hypothetical protein [Chthoniobacterales bacterium]
MNASSIDSTKRTSPSAIGLLLLVTLVALSFFFAPGGSDVEIWNNWMREISHDGVLSGYSHSDTDYPPLAFVLLGAVSHCAVVSGLSQFFVLKLSLFLFLVATSLCFYLFTRNALLTAALELALLLNSMGLAYLDIYFAPFLIAGLFLLQRGNLNLGFVLFTISCCIKWQPLIIAPFVCIYVLVNANQGAPVENKARMRRQLIPFALAGAVALALLLIFGGKIFDSLTRAMTRHAFLSAYALNLSWLQTWALHLINPENYGALKNGEIDIFLTRDPLIVWPDKVLFYLSYLAILISFVRQPKTFERLIVYSILGYLAYFCFNTGVHENHLFLVCCLAWILVFISPGQLVRAINLTLAANANLFLFYGVFGDRLQRVIAGVDITLLFALANLCLFAGFLVQTIRRDGLDLWLIKIQPRENRGA